MLRWNSDKRLKFSSAQQEKLTIRIIAEFAEVADWKRFLCWRGVI